MNAINQYRLSILAFAIASFCYILEQFIYDRLLIASGELMPRGFINPMGGQGAVWLEWGLSLVAIAIIVFRSQWQQRAFFILGLITFWGLLQNFSNHGLLLVLGQFYLSHKNANTLLKVQLLLLYVLAGANKLVEAFYDGQSLTNLASAMDFQGRHGLIILDPQHAEVMGIMTVLAELGMPLILIFAPIVGIVSASAMHLGFALFMPGLWGFAVIAAAYLTAFIPSRYRQK